MISSWRRTAAMVRAVAARSLAHGELVLDDPVEVAGLDALGPLALHWPRGSCCHDFGCLRRRRARRGRGSWRALHASPTLAASEPSSRSSGGVTEAVAGPRGEPASEAQQAPRKPLRLVPTTHRPAEAHELVEVAQQGQVVVGRLAEPDARVDPDLGHPGAARLGRPLGEEGRDLGDDVVVARARAAWCAGSPCMCMATQPTPSSAATGQQAGRHVVDEGGAGGDRRARPPPACGCRSRPARAAASASMTGTTRRSSSRLGTGSAPGRVDSPPTSTTVGALGDQLRARARWRRRRSR